MLAVADNVGQVHLFMEGSYLLGTLALREASFPRSVYKLRDHFFAHLGPAAPGEGAVDVRPLTVKLPYLMTRHCRDVARVSTAARELVSYVIHVIKDMRDAWFGSEPQSGARDLGPKWIQSLEARQAKEFGRKYSLRLGFEGLAQGHPRGGPACIARFDMPAHDGSVLRGTYGLSWERRAYEREGALSVRIHLPVRSAKMKGVEHAEVGDHDDRCSSEASGHVRKARGTSAAAVVLASAGSSGMGCVVRMTWHSSNRRGIANSSSARPEYAVCQFKIASVEACLEYTASAIIQSSWLAAAARKELLRFREFMKWIRYGKWRSSRAIPPDSQASGRDEPDEHGGGSQRPAPPTRHPRGERVPDV